MPNLFDDARARFEAAAIDTRLEFVAQEERILADSRARVAATRAAADKAETEYMDMMFEFAADEEYLRQLWRDYQILGLGAERKYHEW